MLPIKQQPDAPPGNDDVTVLRVQCAKTPPAQSMQLRSAGMCCRPNRRRSLHPDRRPQEYLDDTVYPYSRVPRQNLALPRSPTDADWPPFRRHASSAQRIPALRGELGRGCKTLVATVSILVGGCVSSKSKLQNATGPGQAGARRGCSRQLRFTEWAKGAG